MAELQEIIAVANAIVQDAQAIIDGVQTTYNKLSEAYDTLSRYYRRLVGTLVTKYVPPQNFSTLKSHLYVNVHVANIVLHRLVSIDFSSAIQRRILFGYCELLTTYTSILFDRERIPDDTTYVSFFTSPLYSDYVTLMNALSVPSNASGDVYNEHLLAYTTASRNLLQNFSSAQLTRNELESTYHIRWVEI